MSLMRLLNIAFGAFAVRKQRLLKGAARTDESENSKTSRVSSRIFPRLNPRLNGNFSLWLLGAYLEIDCSLG
jgi:hypothetical protein